MSDYISREAAIHAITEAYDEVLSVADAIECLDRIPAADVRTVVRGKWVETAISTNDGLSHLFGFKCSNCGGFCMGESNFCPNCGAEMRPEIADETNNGRESE